MRWRAWTVVVMVFLTVGCDKTAQPSRPELTDAHREVARQNGELALAVFASLRDQPGNIVLSPYGISHSLAILLSGADGVTRDELLTALQSTPKLEAELHTAHGELFRWLGDDKGTPNDQLDVATGMFIQRDTDILRSFLMALDRDYQTSPVVVDFINQSATARKVINDWAAETTKAKIAGVISPEDITADTRLVFANAVHFHGEWEHPFDRANTDKATFHLSRDQQVQCDMMRQRARFAYAHQDGVGVLVMPCRDGDFSMAVLLPDASDGLASLEAQLTVERLNNWIAAAEENVEELPVSVPRFCAQNGHDLEPILQTLGVKSVFDPEDADLSRIDGLRRSNPADGRWLYVDRIWQQAMVEVNEEGTEAAAVTSEDSTTTSKDAHHFRADHPFLYLIRENTTGLILFLGRVADPTAK